MAERRIGRGPPPRGHPKQQAQYAFAWRCAPAITGTNWNTHSGGRLTPLASRGVLLARLHHVYDASVAWGTLVPPPVVTPDWDTNDRAEWDAWASDAIPAIHRFMILSGVAHVQGTFCTHPMGNETRLPCGPSLGGALRPGGANTIIDGLLLYDDTSTHERWNCSDADLRRHMANEIMRLSSDKTVPSTTAAYTTYPFTKAAKDVLFDVHTGDPPPTPHDIAEPNLGKDVGPTPRDPHMCRPPPTPPARGDQRKQHSLTLYTSPSSR